MPARLAQLFATLTVFALALAIRVAGTEPLRPAGAAVRTPSPDAHYYLRRTVVAFRTPGQPLDVDPALGCPEATPTPWPHGLDYGAAALAHLLLPPDAPDADVERVAAWLPPVLGALGCALLVVAGALWLGLGAGLAAGLVAAVLPLRVWNEAFAVLDHHVFAGLVPPAVLLGLWLADEARQRDRPRRAWAWLVAAALVAGVGYAAWTEMWFQHALLVLTLLAWVLLRDPQPARRQQGLRDLALWSTLASLLAVPGIVTAPYFDAGLVALHAPGRATLWATAAVTAATWGAWLAARRSARPQVVLAGGLAGGALLPLVGLGLDAELREAARLALAFAGGSGVVGVIDESRPLLARPFPEPLVALSGALLLAPALPLAFRGLPPSPRWLLLAWYVSVLPLALLQTRFALVLSAPFALACGAALAGLRRSSATAGQGAPPRWLGWAVVGTVWTALLPLLAPQHWTAEHEARDRLVRWLGARLGPPPAAGRQCTVAPWDLGHELVRVGRQRVVAHNFTELRDRERIAQVGRWLFAPGGDTAPAQPLDAHVRLVWIAALDRAQIDMYRAEAGLPPLDPAGVLATRWAQLLLADGSAATVPGQGGTLAGLGHLRRLRVSPLQVEGLLDGAIRRPVPRDKLFLWVAGAVLVGDAAPGAEIEASVDVRHPAAPPFRFTQVGRADASGRYRLRVPYANGVMPLGLQAAERYELTVAGRKAATAQVGEADVQAGSEVRVLADAGP